MRITLLLGALCALLTHQPRRADAAPAWCTGGDDKPTYSKKTLFSETDPYHALRSLVAASCYPDDDLAGLERQVAATREAWSKKLGLTDADWGEVNAWAHLPNYLRGANRIELKDRQAAWSTLSPLDQLGVIQGADTGDADAAYVTDAFGSKLSQLGRLGYVADCIASNKTDPTVEYAMCAADAALLDLGKLYAEIKADTAHEAPDKMLARFLAYETVSVKVPKLLADIKALRAKDPAYDTMFKLADKAQAEWAKTDPRWIELVATLDDARITGSRKSSAGCTDKTWDAWKSIVATVPAKKLSSIRPEPGKQFLQQLAVILTAEPNTYLVSLAVAHCAHLENAEDNYLADVLQYALIRWPGFRGPRTSTQTAILTAGLSLDKRGAEIEYPEVKRFWIGNPSGSVGGVAAGSIASIKQEGEDSRVTFARVKVTQTRCTKGHYTSQIVRIWPDGNIQYYYQCDSEITETIDVEEYPPTKVKKRYAANLKPGLVVRIVDGVAEVAYPKGKTTPVLVTGVEVK